MSERFVKNAARQIISSGAGGLVRHYEYVLLTAAHNEEQFVAETIECVVSQTWRPREWVIVSDASTDHTDVITKSFASKHDFIQVLRVEREHGRSFHNKMNAIHAGYASLQTRDFDFIGNLDADVSIGSTYFDKLLDRFRMDKELGIAGGVIQENGAHSCAGTVQERERAVAHAAQLVRRQCYNDIGGYPVLPYGGPDTYAEVAARMNGWRVRSFVDLPVTHHRITASAGGLLKGRFKQGCQDFSFGYHPVFETIKCIKRLREKPLVMGSVSRLVGFWWSRLLDRRPAVSQEFVKFLREEQIQRLRSLT
jgi:glycosyltransferase involved in cell wall biosynthesis